ncbi:hypothetical protein [Clostridium sp. Marseille-P299]|uniref:hypothetical protein n=1 Tax=Clostridium sp. Marseille-P299 TaxID=1805477 RepID=UPI00083487D2|nr:hypothetical protein [Clostridium sp. Marseille-P299]
MNNKRINRIILSILVLIIILLGVILGKMKHEKQGILNNINKKYVESLSEVLSGLSIDYSTISEEEKIYFYTNTIGSIASANQMYRSTQYSYKASEMNMILDMLQQYMSEEFLVNFDNFKVNQLDLYNGLNLIYMNPRDKEAIKSFFDYLSVIVKE